MKSIWNNLFKVSRRSGKYPPISEGYGKDKQWYIDLDNNSLKELLIIYGNIRIINIGETFEIIIEDTPY